MNAQHAGRGAARPQIPGPWSVSRRDFLRTVGLGGAALVATQAGLSARSDASTGTIPPDPTPDSTVPDRPVELWRAPGGPTVEDQAFELDYEIDKIFRFVAEEVRYDPYAGVLRGAQGTLWSRAGNSADQAMLLAALLEQALVPTRFVIGSLDDDAADRLAETARVDEASLREHVAPIFAPTEPLPPPSVPAESIPEQDELLAELPGRLAGILEASRSQLDDGVTTIADALADAGITIAEPSFAPPDRERTEHVWVQYADGPTWIDLDPSLPDDGAGRTPTTTIDRVPDELHHAVTLALVAEVVAAGQPVRQELMTHHAFTKDLVGLPITILHAKPEGLAGLGASITGSLEGSVQYIPSLLLGETVEVGAGRVTFPTGEGLGGVFSDTGTGNEGDTLGEWLELTFSSPDRPPTTATREIFDRVGYAERAGGPFDVAAIPPVEFVDLDAESPQEYLPLRSIWSIGIAGCSVPWGFFQQDPAVSDIFSDLGYVSHGYHFVRDALAIEVAADRGYRYFPDAANAIAFVITPVDVAADVPVLDLRLDILHRSSSAVPYESATATGDPRIIAGVLSHVAERITSAGGKNPADGAAEKTVGVGRLFEEAGRLGIPLLVVGPDGEGASTLDVSERAHARIAAANASGLVVIVPERAIEFEGESLSGWWLVDPATGAVADEMEDGRGVEGGEYSLPLTAEARAINSFVRLAGCIGKYAIYASALLGAASEIGNATGSPGIGGALAVAAAIAGGVKDAVGETPAAGAC